MHPWRVAFFAAWICATWLLLTPIPPATGAEDLVLFDKLAHVGIFAVLATLARLGFRGREPAATFVALVAYALVIEIVQPLFGRAFDWLDLAAGALGALAAFLFPRRGAR